MSPLTRVWTLGGAAVVAVWLLLHNPCVSRLPDEDTVGQERAQLRADHGPRLADPLWMLWPGMSFERLYAKRLTAYGVGVERLVRARGGSTEELAAVLAEALVRAKAAEREIWDRLILGPLLAAQTLAPEAAWRAYTAHVEAQVLANRQKTTPRQR